MEKRNWNFLFKVKTFLSPYLLEKLENITIPIEKKIFATSVLCPEDQFKNHVWINQETSRTTFLFRDWNGCDQLN